MKLSLIKDLNTVPIANAGNDTIIEEGIQGILLDGLSSKGNNIVSYKWEQVAGPPVTLILDEEIPINSDLNGSRIFFNAPFDAYQDLVFKLTVRNVIGVESEDLVIIKVKNNLPPVIKIKGPDVVSSGETDVILNASESFDPENKGILSYKWNQTNGTSVSLDNFEDDAITFDAPSVVIDDILVFNLTVLILMVIVPILQHH